MPSKNEKDLIDIPDNVKNEITFFFASKVEDVLAQAFIEQKKTRKSTVSAQTVVEA